MVQPASFSRILPTLTGNPPTPPRDSDTGEPKLNFFSRLLSKEVSSESPSNAKVTPNSSSESPNQTAGSLRKKVAWDDDKASSEINAHETTIVHPLPPSGERKPIKSILKPYNADVQTILGTTSKLFPPHTYANLAAMLESVAQQLAGRDRTSKMDAYATLSSVLKASENVPDVRALKEKMGLLLQFIRRDLTAKTPAGTLDTTLVVNALILLSIFLHRSAIAETLNADFKVYLVDHSIRSFEDPTMSKDVVKHLMLILAEQNFSPKIMNAERVGRLIAALHDIEQHVKGKSIVVGRINIYRTLLRQSRTHMINHTEWMLDLFSDMLSSIKETRTSAIALGLESGLVLGAENNVSRAFMDLFSAEIPDSPDQIKFGDYYAGRLKDMIEVKYEIATVPQIWSVPILFLRCRSRQFEQWAFMNAWLGIIQECFNCSDQQAKFEANLAWNRLVFAVRPDEKTTSQMVQMLYRPLQEQLKRKSKSLSMNKNRKAALGSLCNLLYYSLKPTSTATQLDLYWDQYVAKIVGKVLTPANALGIPELVRQDLIDACQILTGLFDTTTPRPWKETRAMDASPGREIVMGTSELPALDSKWLRKSASRIFPVLGPLLERLYWDLSEENSLVATLWKTYITSIASPAVKEVKVSNETMSCVACIFGLLYKIWQGGFAAESLQSPRPSNGPTSESFLSSFESIISKTIAGLGLLPFTEKLLSNGNQDTFIVIATPSHQPKKSRGEAKCPLHHLFILFTNPSPGLQYNGMFAQTVRKILSHFFDARPSRKGQMDLIRDLLELLPTENSEPCRILWSLLADFATFAIDTRDDVNGGPNGNNDQPLGADYKAALKILEFGAELSPHQPLPGWKTLFEALVTSATIDAGDAGRAIAVIEPLARALQTKFCNIDGQPSSFGSFYLRTILSKTTYPKDRQAFDAARRRVWGIAAAGTSFDPYSHLYEYMRETLQKAYASVTNSRILDDSDLLSTTKTLLGRCPALLLPNVLAKLQSGIGCWILDESSRLGGGTDLAQSVYLLWSKICSLVFDLALHSSHSKLLKDLEYLICSGLESKHRKIVNSSIGLWNSAFGTSEEKLVYPIRVKDALLRLRPIAALQLPFFPESLDSDGPVGQRQPPSFAETQNDPNVFSSTSSDSIMKKVSTGQIDTSPYRKFTPQVVIEVAQSVPVKRSRELTPDPTVRKSKKKNLAPKLRHNDSQIQFEAIESSPIVDTVFDSQLLTDRQKEVKERQQAEAAMFPDIRSSPKSKRTPIQKKHSSNMELPFHRSVSKSHSSPSAAVGRQSTPTLATHGEYDDYVNSSPTPTRALREDTNMADPPSSPPEAAAEEQATTSAEDEADIPSSPPEIPPGLDNDTTESLDPSAQLDPCAIENDPILSTFESTLDQPNNFTALNLSVQINAPNPEVIVKAFDLASSFSGPVDTPVPGSQNDVLITDVGSSEVNKPAEGILEAPADTSSFMPGSAEVKEPAAHDVQGRLDKSSSVPDFAKLEQSAIETPNTPVRVCGSSPTTQRTSKSPLFHDALTSPAASDRVSINEEVFEDAVSSPRLNPGGMKNQQTSSPLSYLDESSVMRLMQGYDQGSGRPRRSVRLDSNREDNSDPALPGPSKDLTHRLVPPEPAICNSNFLAESEVDNKEFNLKLSRSTDEAKQSSPLPSLIPETPGTTVGKNLQIVNGEEIDLEDTIVVDDSILEDEEAPVPKRKTGRKRKSDQHLDHSRAPASKKAKQEEATGAMSEVPDSQDAISDIFSPKKARTQKIASIPKKRKGRLPKHSSRLTSETETRSEPEGPQSFSSASLDASNQDLDMLDGTADASNSSAVELIMEERIRLPQTVVETADEDASAKENGKSVSIEQTGEEKRVDEYAGSASLEENQNTSNFELVGETMFDGRSVLEKENSIPTEPKAETHEVVLDTPVILAIASEPVVQPVPSQVDVCVQTGVVVGVSTAEGLKEKLRSIIGDLGAIALSRHEMNDLEDLFMDAKQQLYGAGRRGRADS